MAGQQAKFVEGNLFRHVSVMALTSRPAELRASIVEDGHTAVDVTAAFVVSR